MSQSRIKPTVWKRFIDDVFSLWDIDKQEIDLFLEEANSFHPAIKFTAEISDKEITFLDAVVYKRERFQKDAILDIKTNYKPTETFQYTHYTSCHPPGVKRGFIKGEAIRLLRTNSSEKNFQESLSNFKTRLLACGYPKNVLERILSEVSFAGRQSALKQKKDSRANITTCHDISPRS